MSTTSTEVTLIEEKVRELCQGILKDPAYLAANKRIEDFQQNDSAQKLVSNWQEKAAFLNHMHQDGKSPSNAEIAEAESLRDSVMGNKVAAEFCEAEESLNDLFGTIMKYVQKTLQNGRIPTEEDLSDCCGSGG